MNLQPADHHSADQDDDPADRDDVPSIARQDLHDAVRAKAMTLVEALGPAYFADVHLPGAINLTPTMPTTRAVALLPDRDAEIVVYGSATSPSSLYVARGLTALGYRRVRHYPGGKEEWVENGLPVERGG